jgi:Fe-S oxidoreductase
MVVWSCNRLIDKTCLFKVCKSESCFRQKRRSKRTYFKKRGLRLIDKTCFFKECKSSVLLTPERRSQEREIPYITTLHSSLHFRREESSEISMF